ncbi:unnamed protein product [Withania somnifera]
MSHAAFARDFSTVGYSPDDLTSIDNIINLFETWMEKHSKIYKSIDEKLHRFEIFRDNLKHIDERNNIVSNYWLGLNELADLSHDEFKKMYLGLKVQNERSHDKSTQEFIYRDFMDLPKSVDWRKRDESEVVTIDGYHDVPANDEQSLLKALANQPVSVAIEASGRDFQFYKGGVFDGHCGTALDHVVAAVGYGSTKGLDYIIVKNSWGLKWGEKGFIRMKRNTGKVQGLCGINKMASFPIKN